MLFVLFQVFLRLSLSKLPLSSLLVHSVVFFLLSPFRSRLFPLSGSLKLLPPLPLLLLAAFSFSPCSRSSWTCSLPFLFFPFLVCAARPLQAKAFFLGAVWPTDGRTDGRSAEYISPIRILDVPPLCSPSLVPRAFPVFSIAAQSGPVGALLRCDGHQCQPCECGTVEASSPSPSHLFVFVGGARQFLALFEVLASFVGLNQETASHSMIFRIVRIALLCFCICFAFLRTLRGWNHVCTTGQKGVWQEKRRRDIFALRDGWGSAS